MHDAPAVEPPNEGRHPLSHSVIRVVFPLCLKRPWPLLPRCCSFLLFQILISGGWPGLASRRSFLQSQNQENTHGIFSGNVVGHTLLLRTCWWLTYPMILTATFRHGWLIRCCCCPCFVSQCFRPGLRCRRARNFQILVMLRSLSRQSFGCRCDWLRYVVTDKSGNALGYSQAYHPFFIQTGKLGRCPTRISFLLVTANTAIYVCTSAPNRFWPHASLGSHRHNGGLFINGLSIQIEPEWSSKDSPPTFVVAVQPNVPMESGR